MEALNIIGGGAKSIQQAGMLRRYAELGRKPDFIFACSGGALSSFLYAQGDLDLLEWIWLNISNKEVRTLDLKGILSLHHIYDFTPLQKLVRKHLKPEKLINGTPLFISVTSLVDNCVVRYGLHESHPVPLKIKKEDNGRLTVSRPWDYMTDPVDIVVASASIPVLVAAVNGIYYDGGVTDNYNLTTAMAFGADSIVMMHPGKPGDRKINPGIIDAIGVLTGLPEWSIYLKEKEVFELCNKPENIEERLKNCISANNTNCKLTEVFGDATGIPLFDFSYKGLDRKALIKRGYDAAKAVLG